MCLIAYVKAGSSIPEENLVAAHYGNEDGIGVMSIHGVEKFVGRKALKRARRHIRRLENGKQEFAVHFRFATHGDVTLANCHPFKLPNGNGYLMHNGVLHHYTQFSSKERSDTAVYVSTLGDPAASDAGYIEFWKKQAEHIGGNNKLCVMLPCGTFLIVNEQAGEWIDGVWYSQTYSLPSYGYGRKLAAVGYYDTSFKSRYPVASYGGHWTTYDPVNNTYSGTRMAPEEGTTSSPWDAWDRDRYGNPAPAAEDIALDAELKKHIINATDGESPIQGCCDMCGKYQWLDDELLCADCSDIIYAESAGDMLPGWSEALNKGAG